MTSLFRHKLYSKSIKSDRSSQDIHGLKNIRCPECGSSHLEQIEDNHGWIQIKCNNCLCKFECDPEEDYLEQYGGLEFVDGVDIIKHGNTNPLDAVRRVTVHSYPNLKDTANDPIVYDFFKEYWSFVRQNENGNELSYGELANGSFANFLYSVENGQVGVRDYLEGCHEEDPNDKEIVRLLKQLDKIERKYHGKK